MSRCCFRRHSLTNTHQLPCLFLIQIQPSCPDLPWCYHGSFCALAAMYVFGKPWIPTSKEVRGCCLLFSVADDILTHYDRSIAYLLLAAAWKGFFTTIPKQRQAGESPSPLFLICFGSFRGESLLFSSSFSQEYSPTTLLVPYSHQTKLPGPTMVLPWVRLGVGSNECVREAVDSNS